MPGKNCCLPHCSTSQTPKHAGIKLFKVSTRKDDFYSNWRSAIISVISRYRVMDKIFKARIENGRAFICERHYPPTDFEFTSM